MISRYEAVLNGQALSSISTSILILDINYSAPTYQNEVYTVAKRQGGRIYRKHADKLLTTITFAIRAYDIRERQSICNAVQQWAGQGGILQTNDREGQRLRCVCEQLPTITSALKWTDPLTVTFAAYALPFWEESIPAELTLSGTSGSGSLWVPGCVEGALVEVDATTSAAITSLSTTVNSRTLSLTGISVAANKVIKIAYDDEMIQSIKVGATSLLAKRTGVDDLLANCGKSNTMSFSSDASVSVVFRVRGLWV